MTALEFPMIPLTMADGQAPLGELIGIDGSRLRGRLLGVRIWPGQHDANLPVSQSPSAFFYLQTDAGQMMVPLDQVAEICLDDADLATLSIPAYTHF